MIYRIVTVSILICLTCLSFSHVTTYKYSNDIALEKDLNKAIEEYGIIGLDIAVVKRDTIIYNRTFGLKYFNNKDSIPYSSEDICWIGSISKTFVATGIMQLMENGKLQLDDNAQNYLNFTLRNPYYPKDPITIRMLLTHKSSIYDYGSWFSFDFINPKVNSNYTRYYLHSRPGLTYKYCNYNYNILAAIIENVSKMRFDDYIEKNITNPIGMYGDYNCNRLDTTKFVRCYHYDRNLLTFTDSRVPYKLYKNYLLDNYKTESYTGLLYPAAGMKTSAYELSKYMMMHMHDGVYKNIRILSSKSESAMREIAYGTENYGLSFREYKGLIDNEILCGQTGGGELGEKTAMIFHPKGLYGFVIITNGSKSKYIDGYADMHKSLIRILYNHLISI